MLSRLGVMLSVVVHNIEMGDEIRIGSRGGRRRRTFVHVCRTNVRGVMFSAVAIILLLCVSKALHVMVIFTRECGETLMFSSLSV